MDSEQFRELQGEAWSPLQDRVPEPLTVPVSARRIGRTAGVVFAFMVGVIALWAIVFSVPRLDVAQRSASSLSHNPAPKPNPTATPAMVAPNPEADRVVPAQPAGPDGDRADSPAPADASTTIAAAPATKPVPKSPAAPPRARRDWSGTGSAYGQQFYTGDSWVLQYSYDCTALPGSTSFFQVDIETAAYGRDIAVSEVGGRSSGTGPRYPAGTYSLSIHSPCAWHIWSTN